MLQARGDVVISIDADLQDDLEAMAAMLEQHAAGADIVYGVRSSREVDSPAKRVSARMFYRMLAWLDVEVVYDHADYRLMSRRAVDALHEYAESNLFLRALMPLLGFTPAIVTYERAERFAGESKYPVRKMLSLALQGVTSFSTRPLRYVTMLGIAMSALSLMLTVWALVTAVVGSTVPGWASTVVPIYLVCGVQLLSLGVIGEYVGKIYLETKRRPRYHLAAAVGVMGVRLLPSASGGAWRSTRGERGSRARSFCGWAGCGVGRGAPIHGLWAAAGRRFDGDLAGCRAPFLCLWGSRARRSMPTGSCWRWAGCAWAGC